MFENILVPLDSSQLAECVLPHVVALAKAFGSQVTLLRVLEHISEDDPIPTDPLQWHMVQAEAEAYLDNVAARLREVGLDPKVQLLEGAPAERIVEHAHQAQSDLIILSSHGRTGLSRWNVSSVVQKVIQNAKLSVMIVRAYKPTQKALGQLHYERLLLPLDCSQRAGCILPAATTLAQYHGSKLLMAHVVHEPEMPQRVPLSEADHQLIRDLVERKRQIASDYLQETASRYELDIETRLQVSHNVSEALRTMVEQEKADMVMLCAHGFGGDGRRIYGSITLGFIMYGSTPLLIQQDIPATELEPTEAELASKEQKGH